MPNPFDSYEQVTATMKEYLTKPAYDVEVCVLQHARARDVRLACESRPRLALLPRGTLPRTTHSRVRHPPRATPQVGINKVKVKLHHNPKGATEHSNIMSKVLTKEMFERLNKLQTPTGGTFGKCIETGVQNPGHPTITTVGAVASDPDAYEVFKEFFDPVIAMRHGGYAADAVHPSDLDYSKLHEFAPNEKDAARIRSTRIRTGRSIAGIPLPPSCNKAQRREVEDKMTKALMTLTGELKGDYYPLSGSNSYAAKPGGMSAAEEEKLREDHFLFQEPDSTLLISGEMHREWPDGRGIWHNDARNALVWANEEDHMRVISMEMGYDIISVFKRFVDLCNNVEKSMKESSGTTFAHTEHLGYILTCPSNLGTGMRASMMIMLPLVGARPDFVDICKKYGLQPRGAGGVDSGFTGQFDMSNSDRLGKSEVELCNCMIDGVKALLAMESRLEDGGDIADLLSPFPDYASVKAGMAEYIAKPPYVVEVGLNRVQVKLHHNPKGATEHSNIMSKVLTEEMFERLNKTATPLGVTFGKCIQTGVQNPGHPTITTVGAVAGDPDSYEVFKEFFDPVIAMRHGGYAADAVHPSDLDYSKLHEFAPNEKDAARIRSTRIRTGRSIAGIPLPPSCNKAQRREVEDKMTKALMTLTGELKGDYYPLSGSNSYAAKPGGMSAAEEEKLREDHFLFQEPDSTLLISGEMHREWPDGRGIWHNDARNALVWANEEDHMRVISMEMGYDIISVFKRFVDLCNNVEKSMKESSGTTFAHTEHLGYILTCPSNLGTGMRASMMIMLPLVGARPDFVDICKKYGLQPRGAGGVDSGFTGQFDMSNSDRLGKSEVELCNCMIDGVKALLAMENRLEDGGDIADLLEG